MPLRHPFFIDRVVSYVHAAQKNLLATDPLSFLIDAGKNIFRSNYIVYQDLQFQENLAHQYSLFKFMFVVGYYNEFIVVLRPIIGKLLLNDN